MQIESLAISDVKLITPKRFADARGYFSETWNQPALHVAGVNAVFIQENQSLSRHVGTVRGLHFQTPPHVQHKLVRVLKGRIFDVAVDLRRNSAAYGQWVGAQLSAENGTQIFVPAGFAHGFCTLEPDTEVAYLVSEVYVPAADSALHWRDPDLAIDWPIDPAAAVLSDKDAAAPAFAKFISPF
jgi:dTDP-4-dehydrorhamnose 3,5-epimerase